MLSFSFSSGIDLTSVTPLSSSLQTVPPDLVDQRRPGDPQRLRGPGPVVVMRTERTLDVSALHLLERFRDVALHAGAGRVSDLGWQVLRSDLACPATDDHRPLEHVPQLSHVARP